MNFTKKAYHAMEFAEYSTGWYFYTKRGHDVPLWHNAMDGWEPANEPFESLTTEKLYKRFLKERKS